MFNPLQIGTFIKYFMPLIIAILAFYYIVNLKTELNKKENEIVMLQEQIKTQNEAINKLKVDTELHKAKLPDAEQKIKTKYAIINNNKTCNDKIIAINTLLKSFFDD